MDDVIVGFDPGLQITGYAVVDANAAQPKLVEAGVIRLKSSETLGTRLDHLHNSARSILDEHDAGTVAIEELFSHYERPKTAVLMGHARGVLVLAATQANMTVSSYLPTMVKKTLTGSGRSTKLQMQLAVQTEFGLAEPPQPADVADALAVALCHFHCTKRQDFYESAS